MFCCKLHHHISTLSSSRHRTLGHGRHPYQETSKMRTGYKTWRNQTNRSSGITVTSVASGCQQKSFQLCWGVYLKTNSIQSYRRKKHSVV
jgi:hypothetical protein